MSTSSDEPTPATYKTAQCIREQEAKKKFEEEEKERKRSLSSDDSGILDNPILNIAHPLHSIYTGSASESDADTGRHTNDTSSHRSESTSLSTDSSSSDCGSSSSDCGGGGGCD